MKSLSYLGIFLCLCFIQSRALQAQSFEEKLEAAQKVIGKEYCHPDALAFAKMVGKDEHVFERAIQRLLVEEPELCWDEAETEGRLKSKGDWPNALNVNVLVKDCRFYISYIRFNVGDEFRHCELSEDNTELPIISESYELERSFAVNNETQIYQLVEYSDPNDSPKVWKKRAIEEYEACHGKLPRKAKIISSILFELNEEESTLSEASGDNCLSPLYQFQNSTLYRAIGEHVVELDDYLNSASDEIFERDSVPTDENFRNELIARWSEYNVYRADRYKGFNGFYGLAHGNNTAGRSSGYFLEGNFVLGLPHGIMHVTNGERLGDDLLFHYGEDITYRDTLTHEDKVFIAALDDEGSIIDGPVIIKKADGSTIWTIFENQRPKEFHTLYYPDSARYTGELDEEFRPHGTGEYRYNNKTLRGFSSFSGTFNHGKVYPDSLYLVSVKKGEWSFYTHLDDDLLPHSPEEFSVYAVNPSNKEDEAWVSFDHGEPGEAIIQYKSNVYAESLEIKPKDYRGEVNRQLEPSGQGRMTVYESGTYLNFYEGPFYSGDPSKKDGKWRYELYSRERARFEAEEEKVSDLVSALKGRYGGGLEKLKGVTDVTQVSNKIFLNRDVNDFDKRLILVVIDRSKTASSLHSVGAFYKGQVKFTGFPDIRETITLSPNEDGYPFATISFNRLPQEDIAAAPRLGITKMIYTITANSQFPNLEIYILNDK
ncbi:hypothetical protein [Roseivirga sp.]|uniref:hypothetical protein n=1 Tax=Roseivirga sp. TaxID=1964215 RepID=UPI003B515D71